MRGGFSARDEPARIETIVARAVRGMAMPGRSKTLVNPIALTPTVLTEAREHFADHCAICHDNDGSGHTTIGQSVYPKAPDMRLAATQDLTDGELYFVIQNGVRLTAMPAWGDPHDDADEDRWKLVHLIRHLSDLTPDQIKGMRAMNPKSPDEYEEERQEKEFLNGGDATPSPGATAPSHRH